MVIISDDELMNMWGDNALNIVMMKMLSAIITKQHALMGKEKSMEKVGLKRVH